MQNIGSSRKAFARKRTKVIRAYVFCCCSHTALFLISSWKTIWMINPKDMWHLIDWIGTPRYSKLLNVGSNSWNSRKGERQGSGVFFNFLDPLLFPALGSPQHLHRHLVMSTHTKTLITKRNIRVASSNPNFKHDKNKIYTGSCYLLKQALPLEPRLPCNSRQCYCLSLLTTVIIGLAINLGKNHRLLNWREDRVIRN